MGDRNKMSAYRQFKVRERAKKLALENSITFDEALIQVEARALLARKTLKKLKKRDSKRVGATDKFKTNVTPGMRPVQGGSPGLGKR